MDESGVSLPGSLELTLGALRTIDCSEDWRNDWRREGDFSPRTLLDTLAKYNEVRAACFHHHERCQDHNLVTEY